jgi:hypothetical protein
MSYSVRTRFIGLGLATIATHPNRVSNGCGLAGQILAWDIPAISFDTGNGTTDQSSNGGSDEECFLSFIHIFCLVYSWFSLGKLFDAILKFHRLRVRYVFASFV